MIQSAPQQTPPQPPQHTQQNALRRGLRLLVNALFPQQCIGCAKTGEELCSACFMHAIDVEYIHGDDISVLTMGAYTTPLLQRAVKQLKFHNQRSIAQPLGFGLAACIAKHVSKHIQTNESAIVVPIPLHTRRLKERGYNQAGEIATPVAKLLELPYYADTLLRAVSNERHADMPHEQRWKHISGAFSLNAQLRDSIQDTHILLIDDVITTGATATEAAHILLAAGAAHVTICAVARGG